MLAEVISIFTRMAPYKYSGESLPCNLCGSDERETVGRHDRYGNRLTTSLCMNCGLVFTDPMPTEAEIDRYYARFYRKHYHNAFTPRKIAILKSFCGARGLFHDLLRHILTEGDRVLDVGAGGGELVCFLHDKGIDAVGLEPDATFAKFARESYGVSIIEGGWQTADIAAESFDLITAHHVLEHFQNPSAALRQFKSWLKPRGLLYLSVPNIHDSERTPFSRFHFAHLYNFTPQTLQMMALKAGFTPSKTVPPTGTSFVLEKLEKPVEEWLIFPGHAQALKDFFETHTSLHHFLSPTPYTRLFRRLRYRFRNRIRAAFTKDPAQRPKRSER